MPVRALLSTVSLVVLLYVGMMLPTLAQDSPTALPTPLATLTEPVLTPTPVGRPTVRTSSNSVHATLEILFDAVPQGGVGVVSLTGEGLVSGSARFLNRNINFFNARDDGYLYALLTANLEQTAATYTLDVEAVFEDGTSETITTQVDVVLGRFFSSAFTVPSDRLNLIDPEVERAEFARLAAVFDHVSDIKGWDESGFALPIASTFTAPFGDVRVLNDTVQTRHTGWDLNATVGVPVMASANGTVAFAGLMDIRGNYVVIDHGHGVFTGYAHFSQIHVTRGQTVTAGQIIGVTGDTGRSSGPHLHWEMNINGDWVDVRNVQNMWLP